MAKYPKTLGRIEAVWNKLGGEKGVDRFLAGELIVCEKNSKNLTTFPIWKTIKLGTGLKTADDFRQALKQADCEIGDWGDDILGQKAFTASAEEISLDLVCVNIADLGFSNGAIGATRAEIYEQAQRLGLGLCPAEVGPQLRLQYLDQPLGEWLLIGMEPIPGSRGSLELFDVGHNDNDRWLRSVSGHPSCRWAADYQFVFVSRKVS